MPRGFLVKRSRRPTPISYRARCCYAAEEGAEARGGGAALPLPLPLPPPPSPPFPGFGTPPSAPLCSPARAVSEERRLPVGSPLSAESFPAPLLAHGAEIQLWAALSPPPQPPQPPPQPPAPAKRPQARKAKTARKLHFEDEVTTSPVLGLRIKEGTPEHSLSSSSSSSSSGPRSQPLGEFICQLCKERYLDPLSLAQHKCSRIVRVEYRCPECDKLFSCPANLASHRRWHKPRPPPAPAVKAKAPASAANAAREEPPKGGMSEGDHPASEEEGEEKRFRRQKHPEEEEEPVAAEEDLPADAEEAPPQHQPPQQFPCPACGEAFPTKGGQERHLRLLHAAQAFPCKYCPATFYSSPGLTRHINKCHPSENRQVILLQVPLRPAC
ncbi:insulinoma-associated protein 1 [Anolis carolinensis]|uniref:insulinoma-associated protein 1 n=1 Tax=Anolis carolinensis TaxID=28377 RepID=UPI0001F9DF33|nr:PREDICTED: insulinoma-associated protein 1 [Anolis carolinensis]|eukprot:XP_003220068.1 PREDICTED: insulinoma-associated protein 1 [Anolis carolinensis]